MFEMINYETDGSLISEILKIKKYRVFVIYKPIIYNNLQLLFFVSFKRMISIFSFWWDARKNF